MTGQIKVYRVKVYKFPVDVTLVEAIKSLGGSILQKLKGPKAGHLAVYRNGTIHTVISTLK